MSKALTKTAADPSSDPSLAPIGTNQALVTAGGFDKNDVRGKEALTKDDVILPRLAICQALSPQKNEDDANYIADLRDGELFNTLTHTVYGKSSLQFAVLGINKRAIQFDPVTRQVIDRDVPWDDPRCEFTGDKDNRIKPLATRFYDVLAYLPGTMEPVIISFNSTMRKIAKRLNSLLLLRPGASWAGLFTIGVVREESNGNKYFNFKIDPSGPTPAEALPHAESLYENFKNVKVRVHDETVNEGAIVEGEIPF